MKIAGIIAEYNPFHNGHAFHIASTRALLGGDCGIVCVMSGNFVQRGTAACFDKWTRAANALRNGADLILELSLPYAISSAEYFAKGAVQTLNAAGIVDVLSFGSEWDSSEDLWHTAQFLRSKDYQESLRIRLGQGLSFASARQEAAREHLGVTADVLATPNSALGVEYCKVLLDSGSPITPLLIRRHGATHDSSHISGNFASASQIRSMLFRGQDLKPYLPEHSELGSLYSLQRCERAVLARLRMMSAEDFELLPDCGEGLSNRIYAAVQQSRSIDELLTRCKTKRYAHSRLRRLVLWSFLGLTAADRPASPNYLRILGFNEKGRRILRQMRQNAQLPMITKPAHAKHLTSEGLRLFELEARATDLFSLCGTDIGACGLEWKSNPVIFL